MKSLQLVNAWKWPWWSFAMNDQIFLIEMVWLWDNTRVWTWCWNRLDHFHACFLAMNWWRHLTFFLQYIWILIMFPWKLSFDPIRMTNMRLHFSLKLNVHFTCWNVNLIARGSQGIHQGIKCRTHSFNEKPSQWVFNVTTITCVKPSILETD